MAGIAILLSGLITLELFTPRDRPRNKLDRRPVELARATTSRLALAGQ